MKLIIIRHGESEADVLKVCEGWADYDLTAKGRKQAKLMSKYISKNYKIDKIYVSSLKRAVQTAKYLAKETSLPLVKEDKLKEFDNGLKAGKPCVEANKKYPNVPTPIYTSNYEQETKLHFRMRAEYMLSKIIAENEDSNTIAIITHGGMISRLYQSFLKLPIDTEIRVDTAEACFHEWTIKPGRKFIDLANSCPYETTEL